MQTLVAQAGGFFKNESNIGTVSSDNQVATALLNITSFSDFESGDIVRAVNEPFVTGDTYEVTADKSLFKDSDYYPSENEKVLKFHFNTNFAIGPVFNGKKARLPHGIIELRLFRNSYIITST